MNKKGFNMIEIMVAVIVLGILSSTFIWNLTSYIEKSKGAEAKEILTKAFGGFNRLIIDMEPTNNINWSMLGFDWDPNGFDPGKRYFDYAFDNTVNPTNLTATRIGDPTKWISINLRSGRMTNSGFYGKW